MSNDRITKTVNLKFGAIALAAISWPCATHAATVTITESFSNGTQAATANFIFNDDGATTTLSIQLINDMTVTGDGNSPQWLQGLFFDIAGSPTLSYLGLGGDGVDDFNDMVIGTAGTTTSDPDSFSAYTDVTADHFWALDQNTSAQLPFGTMQYGLGAAGFGVFSESEVLNFQSPPGPVPQLDGSDGGILSGSLLDSGLLNLPDGHTGREMVDGGLWLEFDLGDFAFDADSVSDVAFVFGTDFDEIVLVPVPLAFPLGLAGLAGIALLRRRSRHVAL